MLFAWRACCMPIQQRWVFAVMGFLAVVISLAMRNCLSIAITEMVVAVNSSFTSIDETCYLNETTTTPSHRSSGSYEWDEYSQGIILSSFYWGYVLTQLPGGMLADKFGGKYILGFGILSTAILTLFTPLMVNTGGSTALIILRILMGLGDGITFPALNKLMANWTPPTERSKIGSLVHSGTPIGAVVSSSLSGVLIYYSHIGWPMVFYVFGCFGILWFLIWIVLCYNTPEEHPFISAKEREFIRDAMAGQTHEKVPFIPWSHILRSAPVWASVSAHIGLYWCSLTLTTDLPKYMSSVLKFSIDTNGYLLALPHLCAWCVCMSTSCVADWLITSGHLSTGLVRKLGSSITSIAPIILLAASYSGCDRVLAVVFFTITAALLGASDPGIKVNILDLSPNFSGSLMAMVNGLGNLTGIVTPYIVGLLTPNQTLSEWRSVFWIVLVVQSVMNLVFIIWASGEVQYWNDPEFLIREKQERKREVELK